jgi:hypothetical protein
MMGFSASYNFFYRYNQSFHMGVKNYGSDTGISSSKWSSAEEGNKAEEANTAGSRAAHMLTI